MALYLEMSEKVRKAVVVNKWIFCCINVYTDVLSETFEKKTHRLLTADNFAYVC